MLCSCISYFGKHPSKMELEARMIPRAHGNVELSINLTIYYIEKMGQSRHLHFEPLCPFLLLIGAVGHIKVFLPF